LINLLIDKVTGKKVKAKHQKPFTATAAELCVTDRAGVQLIGRSPSPRPRAFDCSQTAAALVCRLWSP